MTETTTAAIFRVESLLAKSDEELREVIAKHLAESMREHNERLGLYRGFWQIIRNDGTLDWCTDVSTMGDSGPFFEFLFNSKWDDFYDPTVYATDEGARKAVDEYTLEFIRQTYGELLTALRSK